MNLGTNFRQVPLSPGLVLVATPIGNARDITLRALDVLASAPVLAAEDTRSLRKLLDIHGVPLAGRRIVAWHDHAPPGVLAGLVAAARGGAAVAYASEAGTPLLSDPGYALARAMIAEGLPVTTAPGPSAFLAALTLAGLPADRIAFLGFLPSARAARRAALAELRDLPFTLVFFEAPGRVGEMLGDCCDVLGAGRDAAVARELTKRFEEVLRGPLADLARTVGDSRARGEYVVLVGPGGPAPAAPGELDRALREALHGMRLRDAATAVAATLGLPRREVYRRAIALGGMDSRGPDRRDEAGDHRETGNGTE